MTSRRLERLRQFDMRLETIPRADSLSPVQVKECFIRKNVATVTKFNTEVQSFELIHGNYFKTLGGKALK